MTAGETRLLHFMQETARFRDRIYFASDGTAARNLGVSRRTVIRWRQSLETAGHIRRAGKRRCAFGKHTVCYHLNVTQRLRPSDPGLRDQPLLGTNPRVCAKGVSNEDQRHLLANAMGRPRVSHPRPRLAPDRGRLGPQSPQQMHQMRHMVEQMTERPRNEVWDALTAHFGEPRTKQEATRRGKAVKELKDANATPEEIAITIDYCKRHFTTFTEFAICGWLSRALQEKAQWQEAGNVFDIAKKRLENGHG